MIFSEVYIPELTILNHLKAERSTVYIGRGEPGGFNVGGLCRRVG